MRVSHRYMSIPYHYRIVSYHYMSVPYRYTRVSYKLIYDLRTVETFFYDDKLDFVCSQTFHVVLFNE